MGIIKALKRKDGYSVLTAIVVGLVSANFLSVFFGNLSVQIINNTGREQIDLLDASQGLSINTQIYLRSVLTFLFSILLIEIIIATVFLLNRKKS